MADFNLIHTQNPHNRTAPPEGLRTRFCLRNTYGKLGRFAWSHDWRFLASPSSNTIRVWDTETGELLRSLRADTSDIECIAWSPNADVIVAGSVSGSIRLFSSESGKVVRTLAGNNTRVVSVAWSKDGKYLASVAQDETVRIWDSETGERVLQDEHLIGPTDISWSPEHKLAIAARPSALWNSIASEAIRLPTTDKGCCCLWAPDQSFLAVGAGNSVVTTFMFPELQASNALEGLKSAVNAVSISHDARLLAAKDADGLLKIWRSDTWEPCGVFPTQLSSRPGSITFHPAQHLLATLSADDKTIDVWEVDVEKLLGVQLSTNTVRNISAKVVLVGESNAGKSCLAMRLAEDRFPLAQEQKTTHGLRFWGLSPEKLDASFEPAAGERREIVLWDLGGQKEYRLVHQLFMHDTTVALFIFDSTRGDGEFAAVEAWSKQLDKQGAGRKAKKLLIGAKLDTPSSLVNKGAVKRLCRECGFDGYYEVSALSGRGVAELRAAISNALDWTQLVRTNRPELFQLIRDEIDERRSRKEVVLSIAELQTAIGLRVLKDAYDPGAVHAVTKQLELQGLISSTELASGERVLVLQVGEIEKYAGALIMAARSNGSGVPCIEKSAIASPDLQLPGMEEGRLPRPQERVVLECVVQLMIERGICFQHEGLLIFPTLFRPIERAEADDPLSHSVSLYYDFSGAIDNIYASLVAWLVVSKKFGGVRLWEDRAEFEIPGKGVCGVRKIGRSRGFARIDVFFSEIVAEVNRANFISFVEDHLRRHDLEIVERLCVTCGHCGFEFAEETVRKRIAIGQRDLGCPECDHRVLIADGAHQSRERDADLKKRTMALRTQVQENVKAITSSVKKQVFGREDDDFDLSSPIRVLHLSDLHFTAETSVESALGPLEADIRDRTDGLGFDRLDYLVVSGDLTMTAQPKEFERAQSFVSGIISAFDLSAQRCIFVPGNHDLSWDQEVYGWRSKRRVDVSKLKFGEYKEEGGGYLVRKQEEYHKRFRNFSEYFYHPLVQLEYPLEFAEQARSQLFTDTGLQFLSFNSCWEIDEYFHSRSSIHEDSVSRCLKQAEEQLKESTLNGGAVMRIAIWHHPITGNEKIQEDAFLSQLQKANVSAVLHGHIHEEKREVVGYQHPRKVHVIGAGSLMAPSNSRPESAPCLYNVLEIQRDHSAMRVHTRWRRKKGGAWEGWGVWPGPKQGMRQTHYDISLLG